MKKYIIFGVVAVSLVIGPRFASAQSVADLSAQIQALLTQILALQSQINQQPVNTGETPTPTAGTPSTTSNQGQECLKLAYNLYLGLNDAGTGGEVSKLQSFLKWAGFYDYPTITGYFGPATELAVKKFQTHKNIVSSGSPETTGYGVVGSKTRKVIEELTCGSGSGGTTKAPASLTILSPNGGETWVKGQSVTTSWTDQNIASDKKVDLYLRNEASSKEHPFALGIDNDGKTSSPNVPTDIPSGEYRFIVRTTINGVTIEDKSDAPFTVTDKAEIISFTATDPATHIKYATTLAWTTSQSLGGTIEAQCSLGSIKLFIKENSATYDCNSILSGFSPTSGNSVTVTPKDNTKSVSVDFVMKATQGSYTVPSKKVTVVFPAPTPPVQPTSLTVLSPNGGETFEYGKSFDVTWSSANLASSQLVNIVADNVTTGIAGYTLAYQTANDGKQTVSLPSVAPAGTYKVRIYTASGTAYTDTSDGAITISQTASFTLVSPNGGETWVKGVTQTATWTDINVPSSKLVDFYLISPTTNKLYVLETGKENDGLATMKVSSDVPPGQYNVMIRTISDGKIISDTSNGVITVIEKTTSLNDDNAAQLAALIATLQGIVLQLQALIASQ